MAKYHESESYDDDDLGERCNEFLEGEPVRFMKKRIYHKQLSPIRSIDARRASQWDKTNELADAYFNRAFSYDSDPEPQSLRIGDTVMVAKRKTAVNKATKKSAKVGTRKPYGPRKEVWKYAGLVEVVGGKHHDEFVALNKGLLVLGTIIDFEREPKNVYDSNAIKAVVDGLHVGYIRRTQNPLLAAVMDIGLKARGEILVRSPDKMQVRVFLGK